MPDIGAVNSAYLDVIQTWLAAQTFKDSLVKLLNPTGSFSYLIVSSAISADRSLIVPLITGTDTLVVLNLAQTFLEDTTFRGTTTPNVPIRVERVSSTIGNAVGVRFNMRDAGNNLQTYGNFNVEIADNVDASEDGIARIQLAKDGTNADVWSIDKDGIVTMGRNQRLKHSESNLSALRQFDYPDTSGQIKVPSYEVVDIEDEFTAGLVSATNNQSHIGTLAWGTSSVGVATPVCIAGVANHLGIWQLFTGATANDNYRIHLGDSATKAFCIASDLEKIVWIVRIPTITTIEVRIGIGQDLSSATFGTAGAWFSFIPATDAHWQTITREASTSTTNTTSVTVTATNWYILEMRRLSSGNWEFYVNETLVFTHSANQPTTAVTAGVNVKELSAGNARQLDVDYFRLRSKRLGQRWT